MPNNTRMNFFNQILKLFLFIWSMVALKNKTTDYENKTKQNSTYQINMYFVNSRFSPGGYILSREYLSRIVEYCRVLGHIWKILDSL